MTKRAPVLLDLFCGIGGAAKGYQRAGFRVVGVDIEDQPDYCGDQFIKAEAISYVREHYWVYDMIHASPPCQGYTLLNRGSNKGKYHPLLIEPVRQAVQSKVHVIENVVGAPLRQDLILCGSMFDLNVIRHRIFEIGSPWPVPQPKHIDHDPERNYQQVYGTGSNETLPLWKEGMDIDWSDSKRGLAEAIPPIYTQYIGEHILRTFRERDMWND